MNERAFYLISDLNSNKPLTDQEYNEVLAGLNYNLPKDYLDFMKTHNGGEGIIKEDGAYVRFWSLQELIEANQDYMVEEFAPGLFFIGSDGGDTAYGIKKKEGVFITVPFIGMLDDEAVVVGKTFEDFLNYLSNLTDKGILINGSNPTK